MLVQNQNSTFKMQTETKGQRQQIPSSLDDGQKSFK